MSLLSLFGGDKQDDSVKPSVVEFDPDDFDHEKASVSEELDHLIKYGEYTDLSSDGTILIVDFDEFHNSDTDVIAEVRARGFALLTASESLDQMVFEKQQRKEVI